MDNNIKRRKYYLSFTSFELFRFLLDNSISNLKEITITDIEHHNMFDKEYYLYDTFKYFSNYYSK